MLLIIALPRGIAVVAGYVMKTSCVPVAKLTVDPELLDERTVVLVKILVAE
jgi:hypothetical protein